MVDAFSFFQNMLKLFFQSGDTFLNFLFVRLNFLIGRRLFRFPCFHENAALEPYLQTGFRHDNTDVVLTCARNMQAFFLQDMKHVLTAFDVASGESALQMFKESRFRLIAI